MNKPVKKDFIKTLVETTRASGIVSSLYTRSSYCMSVDDNIYPDVMPPNFREMFLNGSGNELTGKACAVHSSSMFAFNFYHWISRDCPFVFQNKYRFTKVYFEVQLPTLIGTTPANMDVVLEGERLSDGQKTLLFIESKFTEHFVNASSGMIEMSKNSYSCRPQKYFEHNRKYFDEWKQVIDTFASECVKEKGYYDGIKQEICHMIALTNLKNDKDARKAYESRYKDSPVKHPQISGTEVFLFYNILFDAQEAFIESDAFEKYATLYNKLDNELKNLKSGIESSGVLSYRTVFEAIKDEKLKSYIASRYMQFAK